MKEASHPKAEQHSGAYGGVAGWFLFIALTAMAGFLFDADGAMREVCLFISSLGLVGGIIFFQARTGWLAQRAKPATASCLFLLVAALVGLCLLLSWVQARGWAMSFVELALDLAGLFAVLALLKVAGALAFVIVLRISNRVSRGKSQSVRFV